MAQVSVVTPVRPLAPKLVNVAAYARVSTNGAEQLASLSAQVSLLFAPDPIHARMGLCGRVHR